MHLSLFLAPCGFQHVCALKQLSSHVLPLPHPVGQCGDGWCSSNCSGLQICTMNLSLLLAPCGSYHVCTLKQLDTNTTTSSISKSLAAIEVKQTESSEKSLFENVGRTTKRSNILHRGRDGKKRELCGPGFCAVSCGDTIYKRVKITQQPRLKQGVHCSQPIQVSVCMHPGLEPLNQEIKYCPV